MADDMFADKDDEISRLLKELAAAKTAVDEAWREAAMARGSSRSQALGRAVQVDSIKTRVESAYSASA